MRIMWQEGLPKTVSENLWSQLKLGNFSLLKEMAHLLRYLVCPAFLSTPSEPCPTGTSPTPGGGCGTC